MGVFWRKGYEATSVQDLVGAMGINRFSLYDVYGDKHSLFIAACRLYGKKMEDLRLRDLEGSEGGLAAIRAFFHHAIDSFDQPNSPHGCLMTQSVLELADHDEQLRESAMIFLARLESAFYKALQRAKQKGELRPPRSLRESAAYLVTHAQGLSVMGKAYRDTGRLRRVTDLALAGLAL